MSSPKAPDSPASSAQRTQVWSDYWASGALNSCAGSFSGNYSGAIAAFWQRVFATLPPAARVMDLCCGNAPLSRLLLDTRPLLRDGGEIDAVDAAQIAPPWLSDVDVSERGRLRVHAGIDARRLPFPDASFDLIMSQYGIEYVGSDAVSEAQRVLKSGGVFAAVLHHRDALPVRIAREELTELAWLGRDDGLIARARALIEPMARAATPQGQAALRGDAQANAARAAFNACLQELEGRLAQANWPDLLHETRAAAATALQQARAAGEQAGADALTRLAHDLQGATLRQQELADHALDERGVRMLLDGLGDPAPNVETLRFDNGEIAGWAALARRP